MRRRRKPNCRRNRLTEKRIGDAVHVRVRDPGVFAKAILDLLRRDVFAAADDQIFDAAGDPEAAVRVDARLVARAEPPLGVDGRVRGVCVVVVTPHHVIPTSAELAALAGRPFASGFGVDDLRFDFGKQDSHGLRTLLDRGGPWRHRDDGRRLGQAVGDRDFREVHVLHDAPHQRLGTERAGHDTGAQRRQIVLREVRALELGDEHRRNAVERRAALGVHHLEHALRIERLHHAQAGTVREGAHDADDAAEAVEQRHAQAQPIGWGVIEHFSAREAVIQDVSARQHHALREAGRAGRVLHVDDGIEPHRAAEGIESRFGHTRCLTA